MEFPSSPLCECEWTDYMSKSRRLLCSTLTQTRVQHLFLLIVFQSHNFWASIPKLVVIFDNVFQIKTTKMSGSIKSPCIHAHTWHDFVFRPFVLFDTEVEHLRKRRFIEGRLMKYHRVRKCLVWMTQLPALGNPKKLEGWTCIILVDCLGQILAPIVSSQDDFNLLECSPWCYLQDTVCCSTPSVFFLTQ